MIAQLRGQEIHLPGFATAHSHAFQRGLRFRTQRAVGEGDSFWSWRAGMYQLAERLDPDTIYAISHGAFVELALAGVTAVGEFHYVHHQPDGSPYDDRPIMADAVIRAARDAGLRITLLRVLYNRAGPGKDADGAQKRFSDATVDDALADIDALRARYEDDPCVHVGIAPHSIRAVPLDWVRAAAQHASAEDLPLHMHVAEQRRELDECRAEYGGPPVRVLADAGIINERFVAVHATHLEEDEIQALGSSRAHVCVCRTTERDLGDGLCQARELLAAGVDLCVGVDSHASSDPFEEIRAVELDDRSRTESRNVVADARTLLEAATSGGYRAIGLQAQGDGVVLDAEDPALLGVTEALVDDAVVFAGSPRAVREVRVAGEAIVVDGAHPRYREASVGYVEAMALLTR